MTRPDATALLQQAQQIQTRLEQLRRELARRTVEASAGGGMVTVVATGELRILEIRFDPGLLEAGDRAMIQDLTAAAVNEALSRAQRMVQEELQRATGGASLGAFQPPGQGG
jgi:DNA-binding YbaB/EbfC family protein